MHTEIKVQVGNALSTASQVMTGLRPEHVITSILFNVALEKAVQTIALNKEEYN